MTTITYEDVQKQTYAANFVAKYGEIKSDQSWDFSTGDRMLATRGFTAIKTQVLDQGIDFGDVSNIQSVVKDRNWLHTEIQIPGNVEKNAQLLNAMVKALPEAKAKTGKPAVLVAPSNGFYIFPFFSGGCLTYDLMVKVGDEEPVKVFSKDWINFQTINGMPKDTVYADGGTVNMKGIYIEAPVGTRVEVYIDNIFCHTSAAGNAYEKPFPSPAGTTNGRAIYVELDEDVMPELDGIELKENAVVKYIGIEDIAEGRPNGMNSDNDFNDVVLAVVGNPDVPQEKVITKDRYEVKTCKTKRYMIEDLGATDDFDFNDVVVDVEDYTVEIHQVTRENGVIKTDEVIETTSAPSQAIIRAMGGTIDFELTIGETKWVKSENNFDVKTMYNTQGDVDYNKELAVFEVKGYDYNANNVGIRVKGQDGLLFDIKFPKAGEAPMIIAVDPSQQWMKERVSVPSEWFY
ncbi:hypothetical protein [uncultured Prevotella sp.]|uniref:hypothetical protein n=1 Tax=uncultured Prevotella sp. TaxID=159272 RepID=UPI0025F141E7|nr:hypothetical protein [uncultured Prevotella sp.]